MKIFHNLTIIDLSTVLAAPSAASFFSELGAKVIKIESPKGDVTRKWKVLGEKTDPKDSTYFLSANYQKEILTLDLTNSIDRNKLNDYLKKADVLLTNFKKSDYKKFQLEKEKVFQVNPSLIYAKLSGYGENDDRVGYDGLVQAQSGMMSINGNIESGPLKMPIAFVDLLASHQLREGILIALFKRSKTNKGQFIHVSLMDAAISSLMNQGTISLNSDIEPSLMGSEHPHIYPYGSQFETKDKKVIVVNIGTDQQFKKLCALLNIESLALDKRFFNNELRSKNRKELKVLLKNEILKMDYHQVKETINSLNLPIGVIHSISEGINQAPHLIVNNNGAKSIKHCVFQIEEIN